MEICSLGPPPIASGALPWTFLPVCICLFFSKLVKASHFPSELRSSALEHAQLHAPSVPIYTEGSKSSEGVGCAAVFPDFDVFISLSVVALIITEELCAIFPALSRISFHDSDSLVIHSDSRSALQAFGSFYSHNSLVLKVQRFLCRLHARRKCRLLLYSFTCRALATKRLMFWPKGPSNYPQPIMMFYPFRTTFPVFTVPSMPPGSPIGTSVLRMAISWLS